MLLKTLVVYSCPVVVGGDFNLQVQDVYGSDARRFNSLLSSFDVVQHVHSPTHRAGSTLDLVVTFADRVPESVAVSTSSGIGNESAVFCAACRY